MCSTMYVFLAPVCKVSTRGGRKLKVPPADEYPSEESSYIVYRRGSPRFLAGFTSHIPKYYCLNNQKIQYFGIAIVISSTFWNHVSSSSVPGFI